MNKIFFKIQGFAIVICIIITSYDCNSQELPYTKVIFENSSYGSAHYASKTSYNGASWIENIQEKIPVVKEAFTPKNALKLKFQSSPNGYWSALIKYQTIRGMNFFKPADHLSFWMNTKSLESINNVPKLSLSVDSNRQSKEIHLKDFVSDVTQTWQHILIPLSEFGNNLDTNEIDGIIFSQGETSQTLSEIYIDQIELISSDKLPTISQKPELKHVKGYEKHVDLTWEPITDKAVRYVTIYRAIDTSETYEKVGIQSPWISGFSDFVDNRSFETYKYKIAFVNSNYDSTTFSNVLTGKTKKLTDQELLDMIQLSNFRYYWEGSEPNSGMALENIPGRTTMIATGASGLGIMAILAGVHRNFITREQAAQRFLKITRFLKTADKFHGVFPHFLNGETGKTVPFFGNKDNGGDLVETSFLLQGLITAMEFFDNDIATENEIRRNIDQIWKEVEWDWYRKTKDSDFLFWHWSPDQEWVINHKLIGWNETMITYFLAISSPTHSIPATMYYSGWASPSAIAQDYRSAWGKTKDGSMYVNGNSYYGIKLPVGVSNGGPLFFVHYSFLGLNPHKFTDAYVNYFENNQKIANINLRYSIENPAKHQGYGDDFWGLTASDGPHSYSANEPNIENDEGKMTTTGALASFPYTPDASLKALKNYYYNYGENLYGYYGFHDAISIDDQWVSPLYMGLNQAPIVVMIENYRSGLLWDLFMKNPDVKKGIKSIEIATQKMKN